MPLLSIAGHAILPPAAVFATFALSGLALNLVPGADMAFVATAAARGGRGRGVVAALGIGLGTLAHIAAAAAGLSALLMASATAFEMLRWFGVAYLLWIAVGVARGSSPSHAASERSSAGWRLLRDAALVNLLNPKVALFFLAFLPQFMPAGLARPGLMSLALGLWFDLVGTLVNIAVALLAAGAAVRLRRVPGVARAARLATAGVLGALAVKLAVDRR